MLSERALELVRIQQDTNGLEEGQNVNYADQELCEDENEPKPLDYDELVPNQIKTNIKPPPVPVIEKAISTECVDRLSKKIGRRIGSMVQTKSQVLPRNPKAVAMGGSLKLE